MSYDFYPDAQGYDLREEMQGMLYGDHQNSGIGRTVLLRKMTDQHCVCWNGLTGSPETRCTYCQGEGWLWREEEIVVYMPRNFGTVLGGSTPITQQGKVDHVGLTDSQRAIAYCEHSVFPDYERYSQPGTKTLDKLYDLKVDTNGEVIRPKIRVGKWAVTSVTPHHGDFGRVEFFELGLEKCNI